MNLKTRLIIIVAAIIIAVEIATLPNAIKVMTGDIKNFNTMEVSEFKKGTLVEGTINFVDDIIGETTTDRGTKTSYYIIETKDYFNEDSKFIIFCTQDKAIINQLNSDIEAWNDYSTEYDELYYDGKEDEADALEVPVSNIPITGKIIVADDFYNNEYNKRLKEWGYSQEEINKYGILITIQDYNYSNSIAIAGGCMVLGIIFIAVLLMMWKKSKSNSDSFD